MAANHLKSGDEIRIASVATAVSPGAVWQMADGRGAVLARNRSVDSGDPADFRTEGQYTTVPKATGFVALDGGRGYWDRSAGNVSWRKFGDRDFYLGRFVGDWTSADGTCQMNVNVPEFEGYAIDMARDAFTTVITGTQALGGLGLYPRGGAHNLILSATSEAQLVDMLSVDSFSNAGNWIVEFDFTIPSDGAGTVVDLNVGIASGTHATDFDSITQHLAMHLDANSTNINFQSKDGTTTVAATDSTYDYTEGALLANRKTVWFDGRTPTAVKVYVDGVLVATTHNVNAAASEWKLIAHLEKTSSTDTYEACLHSLRVRLAEQG